VTARLSKVEGMPGRYATALFELALDEGKLDEILSDLDRFLALVDSVPDLQRLVLSPVFTPDEQTRSIAAVLDKAGISGYAANFITLAAQNRRLFAVPEMVSAYKVLLAEHRGETVAEVIAAEELSAGQIDSIKGALKSSVDRDVRVDARVDPAILGGLIVKVGSRMIDNSLRTKLQNLRVAMKEVG